jgi:imidazole glycerol-phosphate synthase subunit HisH
MPSTKITLLDYGMCNLLNVARAFEHCGAQVLITENPAVVAQAERLVVPGVGAFKNSMHEINSRGFANAIQTFSATERPLFGICVGMQILFDASEEFGEHAGLGILPGRVKAIAAQTVQNQPQRVPHIGWNHLVAPESGRSWNNSLLAPVAQTEPAVYFVHSFAAEPTQESDRLADCWYGGRRVCAAVQRNQLVATQFHPERSGPIGLALIKEFLNI